MPQSGSATSSGPATIRPKKQGGGWSANKPGAPPVGDPDPSVALKRQLLPVQREPGLAPFRCAASSVHSSCSRPFGARTLGLMSSPPRPTALVHLAADVLQTGSSRPVVVERGAQALVPGPSRAQRGRAARRRRAAPVKVDAKAGRGRPSALRFFIGARVEHQAPCSGDSAPSVAGGVRAQHGRQPRHDTRRLPGTPGSPGRPRVGRRRTRRARVEPQALRRGGGDQRGMYQECCPRRW